jgi:EAL domain-containing protein (putative c-di-GMP-specific phosphodiesterase class I)
VSRWAANQFLVLAALPGAQAAPPLGRQLAGVLRSGFRVGSLALELDVSAGICVAPEHGTTADELLRRAQIALHDAAAARDRVASYHAGHDAAYQRRLAILSDLPSAIARDELHLLYQPKVSLRTGEVAGVEALVRWTHPELGPVSPGEFVPLAEQTGASRALTSWVLREALRQLRRWQEAGMHIDVALNLSAPDILDPELADEVLAAIETNAVPATAIVLEITEGVVMRDPGLASRYMDLLRVTGIRFAIDDFGSGYSSLAQLGRLPVDELKIDRALVLDALADPRSPILGATVRLGHSMGLKVVAEGIEDERGIALLRSLECDLAQGYAISRPIAAEQVAAFVAARARAADAEAAPAARLAAVPASA